MTGLLTARRPPLRRVLLIESGSREAGCSCLQHLYQLDDNTKVDVLTCYADLIPNFQSHRGQVFLVTDPQISSSRQQFVRTLVTTPYDTIAMLHTGSGVLRKWKWMIGLTAPAKILLVEEDTNFVFLDYRYLGRVRHLLPGFRPLHPDALRERQLARVRFRHKYLTRFRLVGKTLLMSVTILYLVFYAAYAHLRRLLQLGVVPRQQSTHGRL